MNIQPTKVSNSYCVSFDGKYQKVSLPKELKGKSKHTPPKGLFRSLIPMVLFVFLNIFWKQTPEYALQQKQQELQSISKEYISTCRELGQDSTNQHVIDSLTIDFLEKSAELVKEMDPYKQEIEKHDLIKKIKKEKQKLKQNLIKRINNWLEKPDQPAISTDGVPIPTYEPMKQTDVTIKPPFAPTLDTIG